MMNTHTALLSTLAALALLSGCVDEGLSGHTWTASLTAHVVDASTHQPISGALVAFANDSVELFPPLATGVAGRATFHVEIQEGREVRLDVHSVSHAGWMPWPPHGTPRPGATLSVEEPAEGKLRLS